jgi:hypothetical protein
MIHAIASVSNKLLLNTIVFSFLIMLLTNEKRRAIKEIAEKTSKHVCRRCYN